METIFNYFSSFAYFSFSTILNSILIGSILMILFLIVGRKFVSQKPRMSYGSWWMVVLLILALPLLTNISYDKILTNPFNNRSFSSTTKQPDKAKPVATVDNNYNGRSVKIEKSSDKINIPMTPPVEIDQQGSPSVVSQIIKFTPVVFTLLWVIVSLTLLFRLALSFISIIRIKKSVKIISPGSIVGLSERLEKLNLKRKVRIGLTDRVNSPMAAGYYNPMVLIPQNIYREFSDSELVIVILHEIAHLKRFDDYSKLGQKTIEAIFFFHPVIRWIGHQLDLERELACDEIVINQTGSTNSYAQCITRLLEFSNSAKNSLVPGFYSSKKQIFKRFEEMFMKNKKNNFLSGKKLTAFVAVLIIFSFAVIQVAPVSAIPNSYPTYNDLYEVISYNKNVSSTEDIPAVTTENDDDFLSDINNQKDVKDDVEPILADENEPPTVTPVNPTGTPDLSSRKKSDGGIIEGIVDFATDVFDGLHHGLSINTDDDGSVSMVWRDDNFTIKMKMEGDVVLTDDDAGVKSISDDGYFFVSEKRGRNKYEYYVEPNRMGELETIYEVNGDETEFDSDGERWLAKVLEKVIYRTGLNAEQRVDRIYASGGVDAVLNDMENIESDFVYSIYIKYLLLKDDLSNDNYSRILSLLERKVDSDYFKANVLIDIAPTIQRDHGLIVDYLDVVETIDSDYDKRRVLTELVLNKDTDPQIILSVLNIVNLIDSDYDKATLMIDIADACQENKVLSDAYVRALKEIDSDYDTRRVFTALADNTEFSEESLKELIILANDLDSDYEKSNFLIDLIDRCGSNQERLFEVMEATDRIDSDYEKNRVLAHIDADCQNETEILLKKLDLLTNMHSDYERTQTLIEHSRCAAENDKVRALYLATITDIDSDYDKSRAITKLIHSSDLNQERIIELLSTTRSLSSDYDKKQILEILAKDCRGNDALEDAYLDIVDDISSDYDRKELYYLLNKRAKKYGSMD